MIQFKIVNKNNGKVIAANSVLADNFFSRLKGLLGRDRLIEGEGLIIKPCNSVHSFGMKFSFDVLFLDQDNRVIELIEEFRPNKISPCVKGAKFVIELPVGIVRKTETQKGHQMEINSP